MDEHRICVCIVEGFVPICESIKSVDTTVNDYLAVGKNKSVSMNRVFRLGKPFLLMSSINCSSFASVMSVNTCPFW